MCVCGVQCCFFVSSKVDAAVLGGELRVKGGGGRKTLSHEYEARMTPLPAPLLRFLLAPFPPPPFPSARSRSSSDPRRGDRFEPVLIAASLGEEML